MELTQLKELYQTYTETTAKLMEEAGAFDGLWGWGDDPRKNPCHMAFYDGVQQFLENFLREQPPEEAVFQVADYMIRTPADYKNQAVFWYMYAAHGLCKPLIPLLSAAHCAVLRDFYDGHYPKFDRMPVQRDLYKTLKKRAKA